jgi:methylated-DNA-protein-cysteine methyltransferase related protein
MSPDLEAQAPIYHRIYTTVCQIPRGKVVTYGQVAEMTGGCTARMVGYALAALRAGIDVPWQRVINYKGKISPHGFGYGSALQRQLLVEEGVLFDEKDRIDLEEFGFFFD